MVVMRSIGIGCCLKQITNPPTTSMPMKEDKKIETVNDIGLRIASRCRLPEIKFYVESGSVLFWATVHDREGEDVEALQYLSPNEAMRFAKAMEACAIEALRQQ